MKNNYDNVASFYDTLSKLVFSRSQVKAQVALLPHIRPNSRVLIVGGGTGWILEEIARIQPETLDIIYVEISARMIALSEKRNTGGNKVTFLNQGIEQFETKEPFDVIITPFLFDNFAKERAEQVFHQLNRLAKDKWLFIDFVPKQSHRWQKWLLNSMYVFFRLLCNVEATHLADMQPFFEAAGYHPIQNAYYYFGFIKSIAYEKSKM
jgi:ubiquinone/menaquinone biosynthesis C-methylase UbiE